MKKILWHPIDKLELRAWVEVGPRGHEIGIHESDMDAVQAWCDETNCGKRMSFDTFRFKNAKHKTMFLLRWA
jgi:hypothetical protein